MTKIAVVTPYFKEALNVLAQCHESVLAQRVESAEVHHFLVADGHPRADVSGWNAHHVILPNSHDDLGSTPRGIGGLLADSQGYDFIAFLDADNWYQPDHLASLLDLHRRTRSAVCTSFRTFHDSAGKKLDVTEPEEDQLVHVDTNCFLLHRSAFEVNPVWVRAPRRLAPICDRVFLAALRHARLGVTSTQARTVAYRTLHELHYVNAGLKPPDGFKTRDLTKPATDWLLTAEGVDESVRRLGFWPLSYLFQAPR